MTSEQRLDRLERIAKLFATAGQRGRRQVREQAKEIDRLIKLQNHLIHLQIGNEERSAKHEGQISMVLDFQLRNEQRFEQIEKRLANLSERTDRRFAQVADSQALSEQKIASLADAQTLLAEAQVLTDHKLTELIDIIRKGRNGDSSLNNN